jgi:hypothetical protein
MIQEFCPEKKQILAFILILATTVAGMVLVSSKTLAFHPFQISHEMNMMSEAIASAYIGEHGPNNKLPRLCKDLM